MLRRIVGRTYPERDEVIRLLNAVRVWNTELVEEWKGLARGAADHDSDELAWREKMSDLKLKVQMFLKNNGYVHSNVEAGRAVTCIDALLSIEIGNKIMPSFEFLMPKED